MKFSHKLGREKWLIDIIIEQVGKKSPLRTPLCFFFSRPNSMFYLHQLLLLLLIIIIIIIIIIIMIIVLLARNTCGALQRRHYPYIFAVSKVSHNL